MELKINTYMQLYSLIKHEYYPKLLQMAQNLTLSRIKKQGKIKIGIQTSFINTWIGDELVRKFMDDSRFDIDVIIAWQRNTSRKKEFQLLEKHFYENNIPYLIADGNIHPSDYDILLFTSPYLSILDNFSETDLTLDTLICYVPYGFYVANIQNMQYNLFIHNICWKNYALTKADAILASKYCDIGSKAIVYSGYPKMDILLEKHEGKDCAWKIAGNKKNVKKIIYAPHHSINEIPWHSTFPANYRFMLDYARRHAETTSWVFKPHPLLRESVVKNGIFATREEYDKYCMEWNNLPNGIFVEDDYLSWFASSDCMIFDSLSFIVEYLYVNKPGLYLTRDKTSLNEFGEILIDAYYQVRGDDLEGIVYFLEKQLECDDKYNLRKQIFGQVLDYYNINGMLATDYIYNNICQSIWENVINNGSA